MDEPLLKAREVAKRLQVSRSYVYYLVNTGELECIRIRKMIRVQPQEVERYLAWRRRAQTVAFGSIGRKR